jgi:hypothetical protein
VAPARISGVSMLPPWASGTSEERASKETGATPTVPCIGSSGSSTARSPRRAWKVTVRRARSTSYIQTISGSGSVSSAVAWVPVSEPNSGMVDEAAQSLDGSIDTKWMARVSPGSAPSTWNGPVWGLTKGNSTTRETRSSGPRTLPPKASSVHSSRMLPGRTRRTGGTPPKVQANSAGSGR